MGATSAIQWTDATWNIARGCTKVDEDCKYCYMYRESYNEKRFNPRKVTRTKTVFTLPLRIKEPSKIFLASYTDWAHEAIDSYRSEMWDIIRKCPQHTFQMLTKRPERITECLPPDWGEGWDNVWLGTSVGHDKGARERIPHLAKVKAKIRFLSIEPFWEDFQLRRICEKENFTPDWVILGGESGNNTGKYRYRPCYVEWIQNMIEDCTKMGSAIFVKQFGTYLAKEINLSDRHGGDWNEWPESFRIRQFPK